MDTEQQNTNGDVGHGALVGLALHLVGIPGVLLLAAGIDSLTGWHDGGVFVYALVFVGVAQLSYMLPAYLGFSKRGATKGFLKGLILAAAALFLLNAGCLGSSGFDFLSFG